MGILKVIDAAFHYKRFSSKEEKESRITAVDHVDLSVNKGEFVGILGHNGSGKSTLARLLAGLLVPDTGYIYINGLDSRDRKNQVPIRSVAGMVFQNPDNQLIGNMVEEDVAFGPENLGIAPEEIRIRVDKALKATGMEDCRYLAPGSLSGGQKQKIAISGILAMEPECIILDEPTAMLDARGRSEVMEAIRRLNREKKITVILITHHPEELEEADRIYVMKEGKVMAAGPPSELWQKGDLLRECGSGLPFIRQLTADLRKNGIPLPKDMGEDELAVFLAGLQKGEDQ